ncbi:MAG: CheY-like receiver [Phenylobacterium sp.]|nr:CheY-like receiver [Phenylobacterium sp.]
MGSVLVVEDDHAIREVMCDVLRDRGFTVDCVRNDQEAYQRIAARPPPSILVIDVNLGRGTTGYDVARYARQVMPDVAVVYVSGEVQPGSFKAFGVPESEFLEKPFAPEELVAVVMRKLCPSP